MSGRRVLFVVTQLGYGGAETQLIALTRQLVARGDDVAVVSLFDPAALTDQLDAIGVPCTSYGTEKSGWKATLKLAATYRHVRPDIVHSHTAPANLVARAARMLVPVPVLISSAHNVNEGGAARELAYRMTDGLTDLTTNVSRVAVDRYVRVKAVPEHRIRYAPNGIELDRFVGLNGDHLREELGLSPEAFLFLAVGSLSEQKDYPNMLDAIRLALDEAAFHVVIIGGGPLEQQLKDGINARNLGEQVHFVGTRPDVAQWMAAADAYLMSSAWEGLPIVLLEAAASSLPIVATNVGGNEEIVDSRGGALVPKRDARALAIGMTSVLTASAAERSAMGRANRERVEASFSMEATADRWDRWYEELLADKVRGLGYVPSRRGQ